MNTPVRRPPSNFAFLKDGWPELTLEAAKAERNAAIDPRAACFYARRAIELTVQWLYDADRSLQRPYKRDLAAMLFEPTFQNAVDERVRVKMDLLRKQGNSAVHDRRAVAADSALAAVRELFHVLHWLARTYARDPAHRPPDGHRFDPAAVPRPPTAEQRQASREELQRRLGEQARRDAELERTRSENGALQQELERLRAEVADAKRLAAAAPDTHDYDEQQTRDHYIDLLLREAGWALADPRDVEFPVDGMPNGQGRGFVDYVLWGDDGLPLALVEAKRTRRNPQEGQQQARLYADALEQRFGRRPVIFYSNGYETWLWDDARHPPRRVEGFYTRGELEHLQQRGSSALPLADAAIDTTIVERHYQQRAIRRITESFEQDGRRKALVVMATGAGKTRTVIALTKLLMDAGWVKRALFLADRIALVNQAVGAFKTHLPSVPTVNLVTEKHAEGRVYVSTYPTMLGLLDDADADGHRRFGPGHFDLVVIDEAHRSVYRKYRSIFTYFDALLVGLTATPRDEVDRDTYGLFDLEPGVPTDAYGLDDAVREGFLVPARAIDVPLKFPRSGVRYDQLTAEEQEAWEEEDWGDGGAPDTVPPQAVNRWLFNADTVDKVLQVLMERGRKVAGGDRLGKTIVFATNEAHARFIAERFDVNWPAYKGAFARVITYRTEYAQSLIDAFSVTDADPQIAVSVDMLDTGIDVPDVVNLVFFKEVRSKTKFWQMLGRGTRLRPDLYGAGDDKQDFLVVDVCRNVEYFSQDLPPDAGPVAPSLRARVFELRVELALALDRDRDDDGTTSTAGLRRDTVALLREQIAGMDVDTVQVRPHRRLVERYAAADAWTGSLDPEQGRELVASLSELPTSVADDGEGARRLDLLILRLQLGRLRPEVDTDRARRTVQDIAEGLLRQLAIPAIRERQHLLEELAGDEWWVDVTLPMLERARRRVRGIVHLLEKGTRRIVYTDFADELGAITDVEVPGIGAPATDFERFREKARVYLRTHLDHVAVAKLHRNRPLTPVDLDELERVLQEAGGAPEQIAAAGNGHLGLGGFVRSLVGLDRAAATEALSTFVVGRTLTAAQHDFLDHVVAHLTVNGTMTAAALYGPPFTGVAPNGPEWLFADPEVDALLDTLRRVSDNTMPQPDAA
ncbi:DEAD/DEAH box helicase family protein [Patulibacter brassicae]|uniref:DEAD/DEAH box helicase family protein n=1 Tax=Patulibacter brassicae TaxID=1705717 RepID=A0ABU4VFC9_9ACTN|nr:DEAD/DEAH box helicase family protein [Patulibacter brassicae]MDX8150502.1 DEAD/DEAH box helicase family protein [Patulibacter brassicae]